MLTYFIIAAALIAAAISAQAVDLIGGAASYRHVKNLNL